MPRDLTPVTFTATPKEGVGRITFEFNDAGYPVRMVAEIVRLTPQPNGPVTRELIAPVIHEYAEFSQWPEFPAAYARISGEVWAKFDAEEAARAAATVAGA